MKTFTEYFPKYPKSDELYELVRLSMVKSTLVNKAQRKVKVWLVTQQYLDASTCERIAGNIKEAYSLAEVTVRCCCAGVQPSTLTDFLREAKEDNAALGAYLTGEAQWEDGVVRVPVRTAGVAVLERIGMVKKLQEYFHFKYDANAAIRFEEQEQVSESIEEYILRKESQVDRTAPMTAVAMTQEIQGEESSILQGDLIYGKAFEGEPQKISSLQSGMKAAIVCGQIDKPKKRTYHPRPKEGQEEQEELPEQAMVLFSIEDGSGVLPVKIFNSEKADDLVAGLNMGDRLMVRGMISEDGRTGDLSMRAYALCRVQLEGSEDVSEHKRVELHTHTYASPMDAPLAVEDLVERAATWGHPAIAITDHASLRSLPQAVRMGKALGVKVIGGMEAYMVNDLDAAVSGNSTQGLDGRFTVFDLETTGLSMSVDRITEIGAVLVENGEIVREFNTFVNPQRDIPARITELTGITNQMVKDAPNIDVALTDFLEFAKDSVLVAHNANFDCGFIRAAASRLGVPFTHTYIDTVPLCSSAFPQLRNVKLDTVASFMGLGEFNHHRACDDARMLAKIFLPLMADLKRKKGVERVSQINRSIKVNFAKQHRYHVVLLAKNEAGMRDLHKLCSLSYIEYFGRKPLLPKSVLLENRANLLIGSACNDGELFEMLTEYRTEEDIVRAAEFYDYFELQPIETYMYMVDSGRLHDSQILENMQKKMIELADHFAKPIVATGDVHYLDEDQHLNRIVLAATKMMRDEETQGLTHMRSTDQMLKGFDWMGEQLKQRLVVDETVLIADQCDEAVPIPIPMLPTPRDGCAHQKLDLTLERYPQEKEYIEQNNLKPLLLAAMEIKRILPELSIEGPMLGFHAVYDLGLTDRIDTQYEGNIEPYSLEISVPMSIKDRIQTRIDTAYGKWHCPYAGSAVTYTPETAKQAIIRYEEDSRQGFREIVENRIAAAMAGSVRQLQMERDRLYVLPDYAPEHSIPVCGNKDVYFTHYDGQEYDNVLLSLRFTEDISAQMLRICEYLSGVPVREIEVDDACIRLTESADELFIEQEHNLPNGLAGCEDLPTAARDKLLWYKLNYPQEFYCAYFSVHDMENMLHAGREEELNALALRVDMYHDPVQTVEYEMLLRGIQFASINLFESDYMSFVPNEQGDIVLPMRALDGFMQKDADAIIRTREAGQFMTAAELLQSSPVSKQGAAMLKQAGIGDENDGLIRLF